MKVVKSKTVIFAIIIITFISYSFICCLVIAGGQATNEEIGDNAETYIWLEVLNNDQEIQPSQKVTFEILAHNFGDEDLTYYPPNPSSISLPKDWVITFLPEAEISIPANMYHKLLVNLTAAADANANTIVEFTIYGSSSIQDAVIIPSELHTKVSQIYELQLSAPDKIAFSSPTDPKNFVISITNNGNGDDRVAIELNGIPNGLKLSAEAQEFIIGPISTEQLTITMFPSSELIAGEYDLILNLYRVKTIENELVSSQKIIVKTQYYPDLYISYGDIELSKYAPCSGEDVIINITIHNIGDSDARNFSVSITPVTRHGSKLGSITEDINFLGMGDSKTIHIPWCADSPAINKLVVYSDSGNTIGELNESNNEAEYNIFIVSPHPPNVKDDEPLIGEYTIIQVTAIAIIALLGGAAVTTILSTEYGKFALYKLAMPFYTRVKKEEVLNHEVRELVYDYVQTHPGEHFRSILTKLGLTNGTLIHHLNTLERQNFIKSERDGPFKRFYPTGRNLTEEVLEINGLQVKILDAVKSNPGLTQKDLARMLNTSAPTINYHVKALHMVRLLNLKRDGKNTRCFPGNSLNGWYRSGA
jgi:predicted transcriptional regulator